MAKDEDLELPEFNIVKAETLHKPNSILVYGMPGKGKTVFAASICEVPGYERTLVIDTEGSSVALGPWYPQVDVLHAPTAKEFQRLINSLMSGKLVEPASGLPYQCVIIDTLDKAQSRQLDVYGSSPERFNEQGKENVYYKWGAIKLWTEKLSDMLHQADFLTIWVMHEDRDKDEATGKVTTGVMLQGKSQQYFPSVPDIVGYFAVTKVTDKGETRLARTVDFRMSDKLVSKQRFAGKLDGILIDPDMTMIYKKINPALFK